MTKASDSPLTRSGTEAFAALEAAVGWSGEERVDVVERRHVRSYRAAVGYPGGDGEDTSVPPTLCACFLDEPPSMPAAAAYGAGWLNGGDRFEYADVVQLGDELQSRPKFVSVVEKHGRSGPMALLTFVTEFRRPGGALVVRHVGTRIRR